MATIYETTWDRLVDVNDLEAMPSSEQQAFLDVSDLRYGDLLNLAAPRQGPSRSRAPSRGDDPMAAHSRDALTTARKQLRIPSPRFPSERSVHPPLDEMTPIDPDNVRIGGHTRSSEHLVHTDGVTTPPSVAWIAAIHASADDFVPLGTAVVIDDRRVLTCAHLVTVASSVRPQLWVAFPLSDDPFGPRRQVRQVRLAAHPMADLAVVELEEPIPPGVAVAPLRCPKPADVVHRAWWAFGFAGNDPRGYQADGMIGASLGYGCVRLDTEARYHVEVGFSGSGLWCPDYGAVVGVVGQPDDRGDGRAILLHQADGYFPAEKIQLLTQWTLASADEVAQAAWGWTLATDKEADRHWRPRARGVSVASERGYRFRGRRIALARIVTWLDRPAPDRKVLVVTGSPGVGKSAVLGRIVTTADAEMRAALPSDDDAVRASVGSVACAVHAKGKTAVDVAMEIARAASAPLPEHTDDLMAGLQEVLTERGGHRFNIVIDALDEASDPEQTRAIITRIVLPIVKTCADLGAQVVVGTRRRDDAGDLLRVFGAATVTIDLDDSRYFAVEDLAAYAQATLQLRGAERPHNPYQPDEVAAPVAARIAQLAQGNFLIAGLVAQIHGLYDDNPASPAAVSFSPTVDSTLAAFVDRLAPVSGVPARQLLVALAFAEAPGLPPELWQLAVHALGGARISIEQLTRFARGSAANFLVESATEATPVVFRLFHQALSDALATQRARSVPPVADERALTTAFIAYGQRIGWDHAPTYLFRSLPGHAMRAGMIDQLLADTTYVLRSDLRRLIPAAAAACTRAGLERSRVLRLTPRAIAADPPERLGLFSVTETLDELGTAFRHYKEDAAYRGLWANTPGRAEWTVLTGHTGWVTAVCPVRVDGRELLASASNDRTVRIWDPTSGATERVLDGHIGGIRGLCPVRVDGRELLASAGADRTVRIWDPASGATEGTLSDHTERVNDICVVQIVGRELLVSASADRTVRIWDPARQAESRILATHTGPVTTVCAVHVDDRDLLATAGDDHTIRIWDPVTGALQRTLHGHTGPIHAICVIHVGDQQLLASASTDRTVRIWDPATVLGIPQRTLNGHTNWVYGLCAVPAGDQDLLASASSDHTVRIWDPSTGAPLRTLDGHTNWVNALCTVWPDGRELLASASADRTVRIWDLSTGARERTLSTSIGRIRGICAVQVNHQELLASANADSTVQIWDPATGAPQRTLDGHTGKVTDVCSVRADGGQLLASASLDRTIRIWDPATGAANRILSKPTGAILAICTVQLGDRELLACAGSHHTVEIWDPATGTLERTLTGHTGWVNAVCPIPVDGRELLASASNDRTVRIWNAATGALERTLTGHTGWANAVCSIPVDGRELLASASNDQTVRIWDLLTNAPESILQGHTDRVNSVCMIQIGGRALLASASDDQTIRIWDPATSHSLYEIPVHYKALKLALLPDRHLIIGLSTGLLALAVS
ncbi:MAG: trypsin-like peptidase domain-containing protein [Pseudonocardiales bacterium]|nr:trypsin-like peptidase domain-containing protein [Pseudonocardiales bacterium]